MGYPARQEQRQISHIAGIESASGKKITGVIKRHHDHDQPAKQINGIEPGRACSSGSAKSRIVRRRYVPSKCFKSNSHDSFLRSARFCRIVVSRSRCPAIKTFVRTCNWKLWLQQTKKIIVDDQRLTCGSRALTHRMHDNHSCDGAEAEPHGEASRAIAL